MLIKFFNSVGHKIYNRISQLTVQFLWRFTSR